MQKNVDVEIINNLITKWCNSAFNEQALNVNHAISLPLGPGACGPGGPLFNYTNTYYIFSLYLVNFNH